MFHLSILSILSIAIVCVALLACVFLFIAGLKYTEEKEFEKLQMQEAHKYSAVEKLMMKSRSRHFNYEVIEKFLLENGVLFRRKNMTPILYIELRIIAACLGFVLAYITIRFFPDYNIPWQVSFVFLVAGYFFIPWYTKSKNRTDNNRMMSDIKTMYDSLKVQTKAGLFLSNSLVECYRLVAHPRLKEALSLLNGQILSSSDVERALEEFNKKFHNDYINTFCITIKQALVSGQSVKILEDTSSQLLEVQKNMEAKEATDLDLKVAISQLLIFCAILATIVVAVFDLMDVAFMI